VYLMIRWVIPHDPSRLLVGALAFVVLASCALYMWHSEKITQQIYDSTGWAATIGASVVLGALSFGCDILVGLGSGLERLDVRVSRPLTRRSSASFNAALVSRRTNFCHGLMRLAMRSSVNRNSF
jgi:hypothetical protein